MKTARGEQVGSAAALMVFCVFAMLAFSVIMLGAIAYKNIAGTSREGAAERTCLSYIWTSVKNRDGAENTFVGDFNGLPALYIEETLNDTVYHMVIYHYDGWVRELYAYAAYEFDPEAGSRIIEVDTLSFEQLDDGNIIISCGELSVFIAPRLPGSFGSRYMKEVMT